MKPDYSIYPQYDYAVSMTSRGCPRGCGFCHVGPKEGRNAVKVADVTDFYAGQKEIKVLDPNITACKDKRELFDQYISIGAKITFTQGLDIRLIGDDDINDLNRMKVGRLHFAWDNPNDDLAEKFKYFRKNYRRQSGMTVFVLCGFNSTIDDDLHRIYILRDMGYDPYVMIYDKEHADKQLKRLQRWVNNKYIFKKCNYFKDYK